MELNKVGKVLLKLRIPPDNEPGTLTVEDTRYPAYACRLLPELNSSNHQLFTLSTSLPQLPRPKHHSPTFQLFRQTF